MMEEAGSPAQISENSADVAEHRSACVHLHFMRFGAGIDADFRNGEHVARSPLSPREALFQPDN
jgi:hypothetical protein